MKIKLHRHGWGNVSLIRRGGRLLNIIITVTAVFLFSLTLFESCTQKKTSPDSEEDNVEARTPVTITSPIVGLMSDSIALNAVTAFQKKNILKSSATGYLVKVNINVGQYVEQGEVLFTVKTKEASAYTSKAMDSILNFTGQFDIKANSAGIVSEVDKHEGDYVSDGEQLCIIAQKNSLVFLLNVPFEFNRLVAIGAACLIELPDKTTWTGIIASKLSAMDPVAQTESFVVRASTEKNLPENLIAKVKIPKTIKRNAIILPKEALLTDETLENYWVMKLINDSIAVKVLVSKGLETGAQVEILSPVFSATDKIILTGNYGLPDTGLVQIEKRALHE